MTTDDTRAPAESRSRAADSSTAAESQYSGACGSVRAVTRAEARVTSAARCAVSGTTAAVYGLPSQIEGQRWVLLEYPSSSPRSAGATSTSIRGVTSLGATSLGASVVGSLGSGGGARPIAAARSKAAAAAAAPSQSTQQRSIGPRAVARRLGDTLRGIRRGVFAGVHAVRVVSLQV
eukprot:scaffold68703_cov54-Phaeocystis_antarctica.AAC.1